MERFKFPAAVAVTSVALVLIIVGVGALALPTIVAATAGPAAAAWAFGGGGPHGGAWAGGAGFGLPSEVQGLSEVPPAERFSHFVGVQVSLKDKDNRPLTLHITPGTATASSPTSLSVAANDGSARTFGLNDRTVVHGQAPIGVGDRVVVLTVNDDTTARTVIRADKDGFGGPGPGGWGGGGWGHP